MTFPQAVWMVIGNADPFDPFGWAAGIFEWLATYILLWPEDGRMRKQDIKGVYDVSAPYYSRCGDRALIAAAIHLKGSIFWAIEARSNNKSAKKSMKMY
jgi:hypothetical protein